MPYVRTLAVLVAMGLASCADESATEIAARLEREEASQVQSDIAVETDEMAGWLEPAPEQGRAIEEGPGDGDAATQIFDALSNRVVRVGRFQHRCDTLFVRGAPQIVDRQVSGSTARILADVEITANESVGDHVRCYGSPRNWYTNDSATLRVEYTFELWESGWRIDPESASDR